MYLLKFLNKKISHLELFNNRSKSDVYYTDIDYRNKPFYNYEAVALTEIPKDYLPNEDNFFEIGYPSKVGNEAITLPSRVLGIVKLYERLQLYYPENSGW
jgi:hypothetical protein